MSPIRTSPQRDNTMSRRHEQIESKECDKAEILPNCASIGSAHDTPLDPFFVKYESTLPTMSKFGGEKKSYVRRQTRFHLH